MRETIKHAITFNEPENIRLTLAGLKTNTMRIAKENAPSAGWSWAECLCEEIDPIDRPCVTCEGRFTGCRFKVGEVVYVKEPWCPADTMYQGHDLDTPAVVGYPADRTAIKFDADPPRPVPRFDLASWNWSALKTKNAMFMPRFFSRFAIEITDIRTLFVQDITDEQCKAEGCWDLSSRPLRAQFERLWNSINAARGFRFDDNPPVWSYAYRVAERLVPAQASGSVCEIAQVDNSAGARP